MDAASSPLLAVLDVDVLYSIAAQTPRVLCVLCATSRALRDALLPLLRLESSLRLERADIVPGVAEMLSRLPLLSHVWIKETGEQTGELHIDWAMLRTAHSNGCVSICAAIGLPYRLLVDDLELATLVAPTLRRNRELWYLVDLEESALDLKALRTAGDAVSYSDVAEPPYSERSEVGRDRPQELFTAVLLAGLVEAPPGGAPPPPLCIDLTLSLIHI